MQFIGARARHALGRYLLGGASHELSASWLKVAAVAVTAKNYQRCCFVDVALDCVSSFDGDDDDDDGELSRSWWAARASDAAGARDSAVGPDGRL